MRSSLAVTILLTLFLAAGCGNIGKYTAVARLKETNFEPTQEVVFFESKSPPQSHDVFAKLETKIGIGARIDQLYDSMRVKAKEIGADVVINVRQESQQVMDTSDSVLCLLPQDGIGGRPPGGSSEV